MINRLRRRHSLRLSENTLSLLIEATSNMKIQQIFSFFYLFDVEIFSEINHLQLMEETFNCIQQQACIGYNTLAKTILIHMVDHLLKNYRGSLKNEMEIVYLLYTKYKV